MTSAADLRVTELVPEHEAAWDAFVASHPAATFCHLAGWHEAVGERSPS
jgi:hypothetical protein